MVSGVEELPAPAEEQAQILSPQIPTTRLPAVQSCYHSGFRVLGEGLQFRGLLTSGFGVLLAL